MPLLEFKMKGQKVNHEIIQHYFPEKWEMPRDGQLLYNDDEVKKALKLIVYNLGVKKTLDALPLELIHDYINKLKHRDEQ